MFQGQKLKTLIAMLLVVSLVGVAGISQSRPEPSNRETLVVDSISQPETLDPAWSFFTADSAIVKQIYDNLIDYDGGSTGAFVPELAVEVPTVENGGISEDLLNYSFTLRDGITFWDGTPLTCADVEYAFERGMAMDRGGGPSFLMLDPMIGTTGTRDKDVNLKDGVANAIADSITCDGNTVTFHLNTPFPPLLQLIAGPNFGPIYSKAFAIANGSPDNDNPLKFLVEVNNPALPADTALFNKAMGTGPFRLQVWDQAAEQVILGRNDDYWQGAASLQNVIYSNVPEFNTRLLRLGRGDADISYLSNRAQTQQLKDASPEGVRLLEFLPGFVTETIHMNQDVQQVDTGNQFVGSGTCDGNGIPADFFADANVRQGFAHSFNQEAFIADFLQGAGVVAATPIPPQIQFVDASVQAIAFDPAAAEAAFKAAQCGDAGSVWDVGFSFTAVFNEGNARRQAAMEQLEFNIESLNPKFNIDVISQPGPVVLNGVFSTRTLPMFAFGWSPDFIDIDNWIRQWMDAAGGTWAAFTGLNMVPESARWTELLNEAIRTVDETRRAEVYSEIQQAYVDNAVAITLPNRTLDNVERSWVDGNYYNPAGGDPQLPPSVYQLSKTADGQANQAELDAYGPTITEF